MNFQINPDSFDRGFVSPDGALSGGSLPNLLGHARNSLPEHIGLVPVVALEGSAIDIGIRHGRILKEEIAATFDVYQRTWYGLSITARDALVDQQRSKIEQTFERYAEEICAIAYGAGIPERDIFALNGRTEVTLEKFKVMDADDIERLKIPHECTLFGSTATRVMAQNWDWATSMEGLIRLLHITHDDGHRIITMTEPGVIGKVGMNSAGLAVGLSIIPAIGDNQGIPVHVILRRCLEAKSLDEIDQVLTELAQQKLLGTMSAIAVLDKAGSAQVYEILGQELFRVKDPRSPVFVHTNHHLISKLNLECLDFENSVARYDDAMRIAISDDLTGQHAKNLLFDRSHRDHPINMAPEEWEPLGECKTLRGLVFDLGHGTFEISYGSPGSARDLLPYEMLQMY